MPGEVAEGDAARPWVWRSSYPVGHVLVVGAAVAAPARQQPTVCQDLRLWAGVGRREVMTHTTGVRAPVSTVSAPNASSNAASLRYTHARTSGAAPPAAVTAITITAMPHIVNASASHSCKIIRRLSVVIGAKPARTRRVGTACATPHAATTAAAT